MSEYTITETRAIGLTEGRSVYGGAREALRKAAAEVGTFDIFLSHSMLDAELVLGVRAILQRAGKRVYVDWIDDPQPDRSRVTKATAAQLRRRMNQCSSLIYAATLASTQSKWMPWELGYFDGKKGLESVAVMPLVQIQGQRLGQEYLELYPTVERPVAINSAPIVSRSLNGVASHKSLDDLVAGRGGLAWTTR